MGRNGKIADEFSVDEQIKLITPLRNILNMSGCHISFDTEGIIVKQKGHEKRLVVYPAMWVEPRSKNTVYVSDAYIKYAKPYAVQKILDET